MSVWPLLSALLLASTLAACGGPGAPLSDRISTGDAAPVRRPLSLPAGPGALPPPAPVFDKARSEDPGERAAGRALLAEARAAAGLAPGRERVSFLDLPDGVAFAALGPRAALAAPPFAGVEARAAAAIRAGFLDALGGAIRREQAFLAAHRFLAIGEVVDREALVLRIFDAEGRALGEARAPRADSWLALGRRGAERLLAAPPVALAASAGPGPGFSAPRRPGLARLEKGSAKGAVAVVRIRGAPLGGGAALEAALRAALIERGLTPVGPQEAPRRVSARIEIRRGPGRDRAEIQWLFTEIRDGRERLIGEARQSRDGPPGSFDGSWGPLAVEAAQAAADALVGLL